MKAPFLLTLQGILLIVAERNSELHKELGLSLAGTDSKPALAAKTDPDKQVEKLKFMVDAGSMVCGSTQIGEYIQGDTKGKKQEQILEMIQRIPWPDVKRVSGSFISTCKDAITALTKQALRLKALLDVRYEEEQSTEICTKKVNKLFSDAITQAFTDKKFDDPMKLAKLTHCGAVRVPASTWDGNPKRRGFLKAPGGRPPKGRPAVDTAIATFSEAAKALYGEKGKKADPAADRTFSDIKALGNLDEDAAKIDDAKVMYIDSAKLEEKCCTTFGLAADCIQASLIDLDEKCDDICRGVDQWVKTRNSDQGFKVASREDSSEVIKQQLVEVQAEAEKKERELRECESAVLEIDAFKKEVDTLLAEVHRLKDSYEDCRDGLWDAEEEVNETSYILGETRATMEQLAEALRSGGAEKAELVPLLEKSTAIVHELDRLLNQTKEELEFTTATLAQLTAANNVIVELKEKVSALLLQMGVTFNRVVAQRIEKVGFGRINVKETLQNFPSDIRSLEEDAFKILGDSIDNMTSYCANEENVRTLSTIEDHADVSEYCTILRSFPAEKVAGQLRGAIQEHIDEFRGWFEGTAHGYDKFRGWLAPPQFEMRGFFEPMGFQEVVGAFSRTEFFKSYLAKWEHETGDFYISYHNLMDTFAERGEMQNRLLLQSIQTEKKYIASKAKLDKQLADMKGLLAKIEGLTVDHLKEKDLFTQLETKLTELMDNAEEKKAALQAAETKFDKSWRTLVGFHGKKTSLAMLFDGIISQLTQQVEDGATRLHVAREHAGSP